MSETFEEALRQATSITVYRMLQIAAVQTLIQKEVSEIAVWAGYSMPVVERACQELCSRRPVPGNQTLADLRGGDIELRREFYMIIREQNQ